MPKPRNTENTMSHILVITPSVEFGKNLHSILADEQFDVHVTGDFSEAIRIVRSNGCLLAFLDVTMEDVGISVQDIGLVLHQVNGEIALVACVAEEKMPDFGELKLKAVLPKPISAQHARQIVSSIFATKVQLSEPPGKDEAEENLPWLADVNLAAQHLTRLTLGSLAQAALITRNNALWAYAGQLSYDAAVELSQSVDRPWDWDWDSQSDLLRFVRLAATEQSHILYATRLSDNMRLALVFDGEIPFSTIRSQAGKLVVSLSESPDVEKPETGKRKIITNNADDDETQDVGEYPHIRLLLDNVPPPNPPLVVSNNRTGENASLTQLQNLAVASSNQNNVYTVESVRQLLSRHATAQLDETQKSQDFIETRPSSLSEDLAVTRKQKPAQAENADPRQSWDAENAPRMTLEPSSPNFYNLTYACLLIPRFDTHFLTGDLSVQLSEWMQQLNIAYGWRLEFLSIRPEFMQWIVNVPPTSSPGTIIRKIRQKTSDRIFKDFPRLQYENPSGDFWAPGYVIVGGAQPHPPKYINDFIKQTRQRQGIKTK